jgi:hypothetical protein
MQKYTLVGDAGVGDGKRLHVKIADFSTIPRMLPSNVVLSCSECTEQHELGTMEPRTVQIVRQRVVLFLCNTCVKKSAVR